MLEHVREGRSNPEIADLLGLSQNTVKTHVSSMLAKLEVADRRALAMWDGEPATTASRRAPLLGLPVWAMRAAAAGGVAVLAVVVIGVLSSSAVRGLPGASSAPSASPTPAATEPAPIGSPGRLPTGIAAIDDLVSVITRGDLDGLLALVQYAEVPCQPDGYGPRCDLLGIPDGTMVRGLSMGSCDAGLVEAERVPEVLGGMLDEGGEPLEVWSIYQASAREGGGTVLLFTTASAAAERGPVSLFRARDGLVVGAYSAACQQRVADATWVDRWIVHPADLGHPLDDPPSPRPADSALWVEAITEAGFTLLPEPFLLDWPVTGVDLSRGHLVADDETSSALVDLRSPEVVEAMRALVLDGPPSSIRPGARKIWVTDEALVIVWNWAGNDRLTAAITRRLGDPLVTEPPD